jgi:hypothetical protein
VALHVVFHLSPCPCCDPAIEETCVEGGSLVGLAEDCLGIDIKASAFLALENTSVESEEIDLLHASSD